MRQRLGLTTGQLIGQLTAAVADSFPGCSSVVCVCGCVHVRTCVRGVGEAGGLGQEQELGLVKMHLVSRPTQGSTRQPSSPVPPEIAARRHVLYGAYNGNSAVKPRGVTVFSADGLDGSVSECV